MQVVKIVGLGMKVMFKSTLQATQIVVDGKTYCRKSFPQSKSSLEDTVPYEILINGIEKDISGMTSPVAMVRAGCRIKQTKI